MEEAGVLLPEPSMSTPHDAPAPPPRRPRFFRRQVVVDARTQWRVAGMLALGLAVLAAVQALALPNAFRPEEGAIFSGAEVHNLFVRLGLVQYGIAAALVMVLGLLLSHRFSGAALVVSRALRGMRAGDDHQRVTLRSGDFLHELAQEVGALRDAHAARAQAQEQALEQATLALQGGDLAHARTLIETARAGCRLGSPPPVPAARQSRVTASP
jgi:hypothetical protein